jgi:hypothetical protein
MLQRAVFLFIVLFWVTMNVLLWRAEYGRHNALGSAVPPAMVWQKMLNAPDNSSLVIQHNGKNAGFCRWATEITELPAAGNAAGYLPEDMVRQPTGYRITFDGNATLPEITNHLRFDFDLQLAKDQSWQAVAATFNLRRNACTIRSSATAQTVQLNVTGADGGFERDFTFAELQNPQALLQEFAGPLPFALPAGLALPADLSTNTPTPALGLAWDAHDAWLNLGHTPTPIYRLSARLLDRYQVVILVSHVGEILRAELPGGYVLVNDRLAKM